MFRRCLPNTIAIACVSTAWPSVAADATVKDVSIGPGIGIFLLAVSCALLITLMARKFASGLAYAARESIGKQRFDRALAGRRRHVLRDFILPGAYGGLTRVDCAVLTAGGVLCIQTKNYHGSIAGDTEDPQWSVVAEGQQQRFLNPLIQSEGRAKAIQKILPDTPVVNIVVFTGKATFASEPGNKVMHVRDLAAYIENFSGDVEDLTATESVWQQLRKAALTDDETRKDFAAQLSFS